MAIKLPADYEVKPATRPEHTGQDTRLAKFPLYRNIMSMVVHCLGTFDPYRPTALQNAWLAQGLADAEDWETPVLSNLAEQSLNDLKQNCWEKADQYLALYTLLSQGFPAPNHHNLTLGPVPLPGLDIFTLTPCVFEVYLDMTFDRSHMSYSMHQLDDILDCMVRSRPHSAHTLIDQIEQTFIPRDTGTGPLAPHVRVESVKVSVLQRASLLDACPSLYADNLGSFAVPFNERVKILQAHAEAARLEDADADALSDKLNEAGATWKVPAYLPGASEDFDLAQPGPVGEFGARPTITPPHSVVGETQNAGDAIRKFTVLTPDFTSKKAKDNDNDA